MGSESVNSTRDSSRQSNGQFAPGHRWRIAPGKSGNPAGRPRGETFGQHTQQVFAERASAFPWSVTTARRLGLDPDTITIGELVAQAMIHHAIRGRFGYLRELVHRVERKAPQGVPWDGAEPPQVVPTHAKPPLDWDAHPRQLIGHEPADSALPGETASRTEETELPAPDIHADAPRFVLSKLALAG